MTGVELCKNGVYSQTQTETSVVAGPLGLPLRKTVTAEMVLLHSELWYGRTMLNGSWVVEQPISMRSLYLDNRFLLTPCIPIIFFCNGLIMPVHVWFIHNHSTDSYGQFFFSEIMCSHAETSLYVVTIFLSKGFKPKTIITLKPGFITGQHYIFYISHIYYASISSSTY